MRFAIIGIGNIAPIHAAAIRGVPGAELVAVATRQEDRGRAFVAEYGGTWYADYRELLNAGAGRYRHHLHPARPARADDVGCGPGRRTRAVRKTDGPQRS